MSIAHGSYETNATTLDLSKATVLITGGSSGIGLGFVPLFLAAGSQVVIAGRRLDALQAAQKLHPKINILQGDIGSQASREKLFADVQSTHPDVNIVVNNAGILRRNDALSSQPFAAWSERQSEIDINFSGLVHMCTLFVPMFIASQRDSAIINVSSSCAFYTVVAASVYSATKAAVHSYTMSLRHQLMHTRIRVFEFVPPGVRSNLGGGHPSGEDTDEYCKATFDRFVKGEYEIGYKRSDEARVASREKVKEELIISAVRLNVKQVEQ